MTHTDQQLYDAAVAFQAEEAAWRLKDSRTWIGSEEGWKPARDIMRKTEVIEGGIQCYDAAQTRYVHLRRVAAMKAALAVLEEK